VVRSNVARAVAFLRRRAGLRQADLAARARTSREMVSRLERGQVEGLALGVIDRIAAALGASVAIDLRWRGEQLDRLMDAKHVVLQESAVHRLRVAIWKSEVEVSFNWYGDRGRVDAVAFHPLTRTLLIVEIKARLGDVQDMLGRLDVKTRLGSRIAAQLGWPEPLRVVPCLVIADGRTARRIVAAHPELFARFNLRGRAARAWLAAPTNESVSGVLVFEKLPDSHSMTTRRVSARRSAPDAGDM
jgi:transcriptional regulator with XRE-family HTH domain